MELQAEGYRDEDMQSAKQLPRHMRFAGKWLSKDGICEGGDVKGSGPKRSQTNTHGAKTGHDRLCQRAHRRLASHVSHWIIEHSRLQSHNFRARHFPMAIAIERP